MAKSAQAAVSTQTPPSPRWRRRTTRPSCSPSKADMGATHNSDRRRLLRGMAMGGATLGLGLWQRPLWALAAPDQPTVLRGDAFVLAIGRTPVNITGRTVPAYTVNGSLPGPILRWREGDTVSIRI